ncbi:MAG: hypothetical protein AAGD86_03960, partial [Pseudomonadota bacterium]
MTSDDTTSTPALDALDAALAQGDIGAVRRRLARLDETDRAVLREQLGEATYAQVYRTMRNQRRGRPRGKVIVLHGIMGSRLAVRRNRDVDNVWINYWRLATGRFAELELTEAGAPANPKVDVIVKGQQKKYYLPMVLQLDRRWTVQPFAYDWRRDIRHSAEALKDTIERFAGDDPLHLVAHSMGGLVVRYLIHRYPALWARLGDTNDPGRGGRLIMLGTPNHGAYAIPLAMTGAERQLRLLAGLDLKHGLDEVTRIANTFCGSYQLLPSPFVDLGDDHRRLYERSSWGDHAVRAPLLKRAREFHDELRPVVDAQRFVYVAGYDRTTPHRVHIEVPGRFTYELTQHGDGRVPHELGQLPGVPTWWVDARHGDLARDADVLDAIDGLLEHGRTDVLHAQRPATRTVADRTRRAAETLVAQDPAIDALLARETRSKRPRRSRLSPSEQRQIEAALSGTVDDRR